MSSSVLTLQTPAKINPVLEVLGRRPDGYHELALVFQALSLADELFFSKAEVGVRLSVLESPAPLETGESNLIVRAARLFLKEVLENKEGVEIQLKKRIPLAAGLGGGSSDAAAVLRGLDWLFKTRLDPTRLRSMAARLGSDVPFFLTGGTALGRGRGEEITPWPAGPEIFLVLVKPSQGLSTPVVYNSGKALITSGEKAEAFQEVLGKRDLREISRRLFNGLEPAALFLMPEVGEIKKTLLEAGAAGALLSGSGPTVFGIAPTQEDAQKIAERVKRPDWTVIVTKTVSTGVEKK